MPESEVQGVNGRIGHGQSDAIKTEVDKPQPKLWDFVSSSPADCLNCSLADCLRPQGRRAYFGRAVTFPQVGTALPFLRLSLLPV
jgi:hypothetical protein